MFQKVKGVADNFFDMRYVDGVIAKVEAHLARYNFFTIQTPILEHVSLFERGLGYQTDVVSKEMFVIQSRGNHEDLICLRPEGTAGAMRAYLEYQHQLAAPCKVFFVGPMFRYERPQKGRFRQFHQINIEIFKADSILYDAQFLTMLHQLFVQVLNIQSFVLRLNFLGSPDDRKRFAEQFVLFLRPQADQLCEVCKVRLDTNPLRVMDCKSVTCQQLIKDAPRLHSFLSEQSLQEWQILQDTLHEHGVTFAVDSLLVRGLDYYNKTVFEFVSVSDELGSQNTFCGGGRYDGLAQQLGNKQQISALGCGIGLERLLMLLEPQRARFELPAPELVCVIPVESEQDSLALHLMQYLVTQGKCAEVLLDGSKIKQKMKKADDLKARYVIIVGHDEQQNNTAILKDMVTGEQKTVVQTELVQSMR